MDGRPNEPHTYPMLEPWRSFQALLGFCAWAGALASLVGSLFTILVFAWARKIIPAFRKMLQGDPHSSLCLSTNGLEYRLWPLAEIHATWEDVMSIRYGRWLGDRLVLRKTQATGYLEFSRMIGQPQILLNRFAGWGDGRLKDDLRRYAPHLFPG